MDKSQTSSDAVALRRSFSRFLRNGSKAKVPLLRALRRLTEKGLRGVVFGGALRDLMIYGPSATLRDVDIVVADTSIENLSNIFQDVLVRRTRFGGLHLCVQGWMIDVWPLSQTWAFRELAVRDRDFESLTRTTFLNVEAVTIDLEVRRGFRQIYASGFFEAVKNRALDINLEENPFPKLAAIRALITASRLKYDLSNRLARYILHQTNRTPLEEFEDIQVKHYGYLRYNTNAIYSWKKALQNQIHTKPILSIPSRQPVQLTLWGKSETPRFLLRERIE